MLSRFNIFLSDWQDSINGFEKWTEMWWIEQLPQDVVAAISSGGLNKGLDKSVDNKSIKSY